MDFRNAFTMSEDMKKREMNPGQVLVLGFASVILIGAILLNLPIATQNGTSIGFINAIFTATSAVCVTGLVVVDTGTYWTVYGKSVILLLIQIGGLGFMTMATSMAFLVGKRISLRSRLIMQEALNQFSISGLVRLTKYIIYTTFIIEGIGAVLLSLKFVPEYGWKTGVFYSIFHSISAFCNAGFDIIGNGRSLTPFVGDPLVNIAIMMLIIVGGIGFTVIIDLFQKATGKEKTLSLHTKFVLVLSGILLLSAFIMVFIFEYGNPDTIGNLNFGEKILASMFHAVTPRTAGFNTLPMDKLTMPTKFLTIIHMFIGGSPGSTAGGVKTTTVGLVILLVISVITGKEDIEFSNRRFQTSTVMRALAILGIGIFIVMTVTLFLSFTESGLDFMDIFFESVSAFGTVGLSLGITSQLSLAGKIIITITMFFGRLGPLTIAMALANRQVKKPLYRYPEGRITVG